MQEFKWYRRICLWFGIVARSMDANEGDIVYRMSPGLAWKVACIVHPDAPWANRRERP